ncbi:hypothetical protein ColLi_12069 [Colletotrichum liriopes]|uniref:Uncharacterized protein n=1 Tax=Colletotrichum liriopes TaxID=708192 RepID=A0AA37LZ43_9PEZI|nr:hypothetical protein ColLi_12069 [Colletotrichum liriopes]
MSSWKSKNVTPFENSSTPDKWGNTSGGCQEGDPNGPTGTGENASNTKGGHKDQISAASSKGGRPSGGGYGHHGGSNM